MWEILQQFAAMIWKVLSDQPDPKADFLGLLPAAWQPVVSAVFSAAPLLLIFPLIFGVVTVVERKALGRIQNRLGPNRVGPAGFLQFVADGIKALIKEDV